MSIQKMLQLVCDEKSIALNRYCSVLAVPHLQQVIFYGGERHNNTGIVEPTAQLFVFDFQSQEFKRTSVLMGNLKELLSSKHKVSKHTAHLVDDKWMYLIGGYSTHHYVPAIVARYNVNSHKWEKFSAARYDIHSHSSVLCQDCIIVLGGLQLRTSRLPQWVIKSTLISDSTSSIHQYDLIKNTWHSLYDSSSVNTYGHSSVLYDDKLYIFGGMRSHDNRVLNWLWCYSMADANITRIFDPSNQNAIPSPRFYHNAVLVDDRMIIYGGYNEDMQIINNLEMFSFDLNTYTWTRIAFTMEAKMDGYNTPISNHLSVNKTDLYLFSTYMKESTLTYQYRTLVHKLHFDTRDQRLFQQALWYSRLTCFSNSCIQIITT
jgi:hypothetical protein